MAFDLDERHMEVAEGKLGRRLPEPLRSHLLSSNGGETSTDDDDWQLFPIYDPTDRRRIARTANHIVKETQSARGWRGFPPNAVAFASNGAGDLLILREHCDRLERWDHETGEVSAVDVDLE